MNSQNNVVTGKKYAMSAKHTHFGRFILRTLLCIKDSS